MKIESKYRLVILSIIVLGVLNIALLSVLWYQHREVRHPLPPHEGKLSPEEFLALELGFDDDQANRYYDLYRQHVRQRESIKAEIHDLGLAAIDELFSQSFDSAKMNQLTDAIGAKHAESDRILYEHFQDVRQICDSVQQEKLKQLIIEIVERSMAPSPPGHKRGDHRPPPPPRHKRGDHRLPPPSGR